MRTVVYDQRRVDLESAKIIEFIESAQSTVSTEDIAQLIGMFEHLISLEKLDEVDQVFGRLDADKGPSAFLVAALRISFPLRERLAHWSTALARVRQVLEARGIDSRKVLRGL